MTLSAGIDVGTGAVKVAIFRTDGAGQEDCLALKSARIRRRDVNAVEDFDVSDTDILRVAGVLNGWDVDTTGAESMKVVFTEDQKRNAKNRWTK